MFKFELPEDNATVLKHIGLALQNIAAEMKGELTVTHDVGAIIERTLTVGDQSVTEKFAEVDTVAEQYASLAKDGVIEDDTPPPPIDDVLVIEGLVDDTPPPPRDDLDVNGLPWDERIHSKNKSTNSDGSWCDRRAPKGFDGDWKQYIADIKAELMGTPEDDTPPPPADDDTPVDTSTPFDQAVTEDLPPPPLNNLEPKTFPQLMSLVTSNAKEKGSVKKVQEIITTLGLGSLQALNMSKDADGITNVYHQLEAQL
jgi:hypothetical protein